MAVSSTNMLNADNTITANFEDYYKIWKTTDVGKSYRDMDDESGSQNTRKKEAQEIDFKHFLVECLPDLSEELENIKSGHSTYFSISIEYEADLIYSLYLAEPFCHQITEIFISNTDTKSFFTLLTLKFIDAFLTKCPNLEKVTFEDFGDYTEKLSVEMISTLSQHCWHNNGISSQKMLIISNLLQKPYCKLHYLELWFSNQLYTQYDFLILAQALMKNQSLKYFCFRIEKGQPLHDLPKALAEHRSLKALDLSYSQFEIEAFACLMQALSKNSILEELNLSNINFLEINIEEERKKRKESKSIFSKFNKMFKKENEESDSNSDSNSDEDTPQSFEKIKTITTALSAIFKMPSLKILSLSSFMSQYEKSRSENEYIHFLEYLLDNEIPINDSLRELDLNVHDVNEEALSAIGLLLPKLPSLKKLILYDINFDIKEKSEILSALFKSLNKSLIEDLMLSCSFLSREKSFDASPQFLFEKLPELTCLDLQGCSFSSKAIQEFSMLVQKNEKLHTLKIDLPFLVISFSSYLQENEMTTENFDLKTYDEAVSQLILANQSIRSITINWVAEKLNYKNSWFSVGSKEIIRYGEATLNAIKNNKKIKDINFNYVRAGQHYTKILEALKGNRIFESLYISDDYDQNNPHTSERKKNSENERQAQEYLERNRNLYKCLAFFSIFCNHHNKKDKCNRDNPSKRTVPYRIVTLKHNFAYQKISPIILEFAELMQVKQKRNTENSIAENSCTPMETKPDSIQSKSDSNIIKNPVQPSFKPSVLPLTFSGLDTGSGLETDSDLGLETASRLETGGAAITATDKDGNITKKQKL